MNKKLIGILICPKTLKPLRLHSNGHALICIDENIAYPIVNGIPHLTVEAAIPLADITEYVDSNEEKSIRKEE
jgi:uncharacterized protein YbaR (Trm112 family)